MKTISLFNEILASVAERGLSIVGRPGSDKSGRSAGEVVDLCRMLMTSRGEASGLALSLEILTRYRQLEPDAKTAFFASLCADFSADETKVTEAARAYLDNPDPETLFALSELTEPSRLELIQRLNQAPSATLDLVTMRDDLLSCMRTNDALRIVDRDFSKLFASWFNRGFLELRRIDWDTPASILEKIIKYEAVHGMAGWSDLRERIRPRDRYIYGFFHPRLGEEPLIFVEVALTGDMPSAIDTILSRKREETDPTSASTAVFYSISNCQAGLRGIPLGNFLIKQVVEDLRHRFGGLKNFVTLSPIPSLRATLLNKEFQALSGLPTETVRAIENSSVHAWFNEPALSEKLRKTLLPAAAWYLCSAKKVDGKPIDPVARFHLGNGARLDRLNWGAHTAEQGMENSFGIMANYRYKLDEIEINHEQFANTGDVIASPSVARLKKSFESKLTHRPAPSKVRELAAANDG